MHQKIKLLVETSLLVNKTREIHAKHACGFQKRNKTTKVAAAVAALVTGSLVPHLFGFIGDKLHGDQITEVDLVGRGDSKTRAQLEVQAKLHLSTAGAAKPFLVLGTTVSSSIGRVKAIPEPPRETLAHACL